MVYGSDATRATWLRDGCVAPPARTASCRAPTPAEPARRPPMDLFGNQVAAPGSAVVAGDARANENIGLTAAQTIFAREHNRIVRLLPTALPAELRYQIARRVVGAEIQYITYHDFLPAMGVRLAAYTGYKPTVDPTESNEFATVGFRAHSMVHGEMEPSAPEGTWSNALLASFAARGIVVEHDAGTVTLVVPLSLAFGDPDLLEQIGLGPARRGARRGAPVQERRADRRLAAQRPLRGAQADDDRPERVPGAGRHRRLLRRRRRPGRRRHRARPRSRDAELRPDARGLRTARTGPLFDASTPAINPNDPAIMAFTALRDDEGNPVPLGSPDAQEDAVVGIRATSLAARLKAVYGRQSAVDAFTGMVSEPHVTGSDLGPLQQAMWKKQFESSRDGDRFFYLNDPALPLIQQLFGISARRSLAQIIRANTGAAVQDDVFKVPAE